MKKCKFSSSFCSGGRRGRRRQTQVGKYLLLLVLVVIDVGRQLLVGTVVAGVVLRRPDWLASCTVTRVVGRVVRGRRRGRGRLLVLTGHVIISPLDPPGPLLTRVVAATGSVERVGGLAEPLVTVPGSLRLRPLTGPRSGAALGFGLNFLPHL